MAFEQATHNFTDDPFLPDQEAVFFQLWEQKNKNRVPVCSRCNTLEISKERASDNQDPYAADEAATSATLAEYMCTSCMPPITLCSMCCLHCDHDQDHEIFNLKDVFSNMFSAAAGLPIAPLGGKSKEHLQGETTNHPSAVKVTVSNGDKDSESPTEEKINDSTTNQYSDVVVPLGNNDTDSEPLTDEDEERNDSTESSSEQDSDPDKESNITTLSSGIRSPMQFANPGANQPAKSLSTSTSNKDDNIKEQDIQSQLAHFDFSSCDSKPDEGVEFFGHMKPVAMNPPHDDIEDLNWPYGLCTSPMGHVLIADTYNHQVLVTTEGNTMHNLGTNNEAQEDQLFSYPLGLSCSQISSFGESIYVAVADSGNSKIRIFNSEGRQTQEIKDHLTRPHGVCFDFWYIILSDIAQRSLAKYSFLDGRVVQTFSEPTRGPAVSHMQQPSYVERSADGNLIFVADTLGHCVKVFDNTAGTFVASFGPFKSPHGLCMDPEQRTLIVADFGRSSVEAVDLRKGDIVSNIASANNGLIGPTDVTYHAPSRQVLVLDTTRSKLRQFPISPLPASIAKNFL